MSATKRGGKIRRLSDAQVNRKTLIEWKIKEKEGKTNEYLRDRLLNSLVEWRRSRWQGRNGVEANIRNVPQSHNRKRSGEGEKEIYGQKSAVVI